MWTQRDQLQAYQFLRRRIVSALQFGDANHPTAPGRRVLVSTAVGLGCALLVTAGFGVYGLLRPGANENWRQAGRVVIEKESGATYVLGADGALHPVLNYTSARLLAGTGASTVSVSSRSLAKAPRGLPLGIAGAPTSIPARDALLAGAWSVCSQMPPGQAETAPAITTVSLGAPAAGAALAAGEALLVEAGDRRYVIADGRRLRLVGEAVTVALGYDGQPPTPVTEAWVNAIPAGPDLALIKVAASGSRGPRVGDRGTSVGQVLVTRNVGNDERYLLVRPDALMPITQTEAALILNNRANRSAYRNGRPAAIEVPAADVAASGLVSTGRPGAAFPPIVPDPVDLPGTAAGADPPALCAVSDDQAGTRIATGAAVPAGGRAVPVAAGGPDRRTADFVHVPPNAGALVSQRQSATAETGATYLVTDQGIRYPIGSADDVAALGYGDVRPVPVAAELLALLPVGPALDAAAAGQAVRS